MYKDKFVLSIIHDGHPVKETGHRGNKEVAIPFDSEYKIRLKNKNDRSCTARIFIDGKKVSQLGDVIVSAGGNVDLERYVDRSLEKGKKFKFVALDHPDVDDPTSSSNGIIKVEFRKAKHQNGVKILYPYKGINYGDWEYRDPITWNYTDPNNTTFSSGSSKTRGSVTHSCYSSNRMGDVCQSANDSQGATVEGSQSNQGFTYSNLEVEDYAVTLELKIVGVEKKEMYNNEYKYCTQCGNKVKRPDKYCSQCGHRQ